jgi:hypothetical protein
MRNLGGTVATGRDYDECNNCEGEYPRGCASYSEMQPFASKIQRTEHGTTISTDLRMILEALKARDMKIEDLVVNERLPRP